jgi:hypothetical protein
MVMNLFLSVFIAGAVLTAFVALILIATTASAVGFEGEKVRVKDR